MNSESNDCKFNGSKVDSIEKKAEQVSSNESDLPNDPLKNQQVTNVNNYEKNKSQSPSSQIDSLTLDSADESSNSLRFNCNNKRSISPTPPSDLSQKLPNSKKPKECSVSLFFFSNTS